MGLWRKIFDDYFDDRSHEIGQNGGVDSDMYDEHNTIIDPNNPIWQGSEIHFNPHGTDPTLPDPNELNQD
jgi:hypothetical protein